MCKNLDISNLNNINSCYHFMALLNWFWEFSNPQGKGEFDFPETHWILLNLRPLLALVMALSYPLQNKICLKRFF